jgi:hypothetical protein
MGSRRCCSCSSTPKVERCEGCCSDCIAAHIIEVNGQSTFANQVPGDVFLLHQGIMTGAGMGDADSPAVGSPKIKKEYIHIGSFWTWYHPAFMINFDPHFPPCNNFSYNPVPGAYTAYTSIAPTFSEDGNPGYSPLFKNPGDTGYLQNSGLINDYLFSTGYFNWHIPSGTFQTDFPRFSNIMAVDPYECRNTVNCPGDYDGCAASLNVYPNTAPNSVLPWNGGAVTFRAGYPCSTGSEDLCCGYGGWWGFENSGKLVGYEEDLYNPYNNTPWGGSPDNNVQSCNFLGLSKYHRRLQRTYFPWSWQIFSYALDHLIPFGNYFSEWTQIQDETSGEINDILQKYGANLPISSQQTPTNIFEPTGFNYYPMSHSSALYASNGPPVVGSGIPVPCADSRYAFTGQIASTLRQQFMGFAFCEHHYDYSCGNSEVFGEINQTIPASTIMPRRFVFSCSGIPIFQFDLYEAVKDEIIDLGEADECIKSMKSFTMWFPNPDNGLNDLAFESRDLGPATLGIPEIKNTPTQEQVVQARRVFDILSSRKFSGIRVKDWREEAYDEIIEANTIYRESIRDTYILRNYTDTSRTPQQIYDAAVLHAESVFDIGTLLGFRPVSYLQTPEGKAASLPVIFPNQLGPIRKRCRQEAPAKRTVGQAAWADGVLVTKNSYFGLNVLTPKNIFPIQENQRIINVGALQNYNQFENWRVDSQLINLQSLYYADISKFLFKEDESMPDRRSTVQPPENSVGTENGKWDQSIYGLRYSEFDIHCDMVNRISHLCYTYFVAQPKGWDFVNFGPGQNGPKPEDSWWFRRFGFVQPREADLVTLYTKVRKHSTITGCGNTTFSNWEFAWNPSGYVILPCCSPPTP